MAMFDLDFEFNDYGLRNRPKRMAYTTNYTNILKELIDNCGDRIEWKFQDITIEAVVSVLDALSEDEDIAWTAAPSFCTISVWANEGI